MCEFALPSSCVMLRVLCDRWLGVQIVAVTSRGGWSTCGRTALLSHLEPALLSCGGGLCSRAECAERTCWCR